MIEAAARAAGRDHERARPGLITFGQAVQSLIEQLCNEVGVAIEQVTFRVKDVDSVVSKLQREDRYVSLSDLTDLVGLRVVTRHLGDVERVLRLLSEEFDVQERVDHGRSAVDTFGYASTHLILRVSPERSELREWKSHASLSAEVQVRSILQHAWASISHGLDYKTSADVPESVRRQLFRVAALLETGDELLDSFRNAVEDVRGSYRTEVEQRGWATLPVDADSIRASADLLELESVSAAAVDAGWRESNHDPLDEAFISRLTAAAAAAGVRTMGDVSALAARAKLDVEWLRSIIEASGVGAAVALDVITVRIISEHAQDSVAKAVRSLNFLGSLVDAAMSNTREGE